MKINAAQINKKRKEEKFKPQKVLNYAYKYGATIVRINALQIDKM